MHFRTLVFLLLLPKFNSISIEPANEKAPCRLFRCKARVIRAEITDKQLVRAFADSTESAKIISAKYLMFEPNDEEWLISSDDPKRSRLVYFPNFTIPDTFWMYEVDTERLGINPQRNSKVRAKGPMQNKKEGREVSATMADVVRKLRRATKDDK